MKKPELFVLGVDGGCPGYVKTAIAEGRLPNFKRLIDRGTFLEDCMPAFPSITPTCWSAISTGAPASINGALCHEVHKFGTHPEQLYTPYSSELIRAERFWEAAAKVGKTSLLIEVPSSGPAKCDGILQVMGGVSMSPRLSDAYSSGIPKQFFRNDGKSMHVDSVKTLAGGAWNAVFGQSDFLCLDENTFVFRPVFTSDTYHKNEVESHVWFIQREKDGVRIGVDEQSVKAAPILREGQWSDVITRRLMTEDGERLPFQFRARLDEYNAETGIFTVFVTGAENFLREITPLSLARELAEIPETPNGTDHTSIFTDHCRTDKYLDGELFHHHWREQVMAHCMEKYGPDIIFDYHGSIDSINHRFRSAYEGVDIQYEGEQECAADIYEKSYNLLDNHLGWILDNAMDENTTILVVSDHGAVGFNEYLKPWGMMYEAGFAVYKEGIVPNLSRGKDIDWTKTRAYPVGSSHIKVNLKGREPTGIVEPADYDKTVNEIIAALQKQARSEDGSIMALAFAVEKEQAGFIGLGGEDCGDVVFGLCGSRVGGQIGGVHSHQIPSARSKTGDIRCLCIFSGPAIKKGLTLTRPADLTDLAPTLCYAANYPQPKDATGGVIFQIFENK